jgi:hypothetical protein
MEKDMEKLFRSRPFKVRNADEYGLEDVLNLFVSPLDGLTTPFEYENSIIKGRMGSGKTMYLRANHAYYLYGMVPSLIEKSDELILPVTIRLSDFQQIREPSEIYRQVIIKIVEEMTSVYLRLEDAKQLAALHAGMRYLSDEMLKAHKLSESMLSLTRMGSEEYVQRVSSELGLEGGVRHGFLSGCAKWKRTQLSEFKKKESPGIRDIEECYKNLIEDQNGKLLILVDEAGALDRSFFQNDTGGSVFEGLMNQLRTARFIRTKIAVYPNSYSDMLMETRYGDVVQLEESVSDERGYERFHARVISLIDNYLNPDPLATEKHYAADVFEIDDARPYGGSIEQVLYASNGNMRRLIQLLDAAMRTAYSDAKGAAVVTKEHVLDTLRKHAGDLEGQFTAQDRDFLADLVSVCKTRGGFRFTFPNMSPVLNKYLYKSQEYNLVRIESQGAGRRKTVYALDYAFCVLKDIPTHHIRGTEKIDKERSLAGGEWINRTIQVSRDVIDAASIPGKLDGNIYHWSGNAGFAKNAAGEEYFFQLSDIIDSDKSRPIYVGARVRFYPVDDGYLYATQVELP